MSVNTSEVDLESPKVVVQEGEKQVEPKPSTSYIAAPTEPTAEPMPIHTGTKTTNYTSFVRFCMYIFFTFYLIFALLILFSGRVDLTHREHLMSQVVQLNMEEINIQRMFILNALFLSVAAILGLYSFYSYNYRFFLAFAVGLLFSMIYAMVSLKNTWSAYSQMGQVLDNHSVTPLFDGQMEHYDWHNYHNESSLFINRFQHEFNCCGGSKGYKDWEPLKPASVPTGAFPISCCHLHFNPDMNLRWCSYQDVEGKRSCPAAFSLHLIQIQNTLKTQLMLLLEISLTQFLTVAVFFFLIFRGEQMFHGNK